MAANIVLLADVFWVLKSPFKNAEKRVGTYVRFAAISSALSTFALYFMSISANPNTEQAQWVIY